VRDCSRRRNGHGGHRTASSSASAARDTDCGAGRDAGRRRGEPRACPIVQDAQVVGARRVAEPRTRRLPRRAPRLPCSVARWCRPTSRAGRTVAY